MEPENDLAETDRQLAVDLVSDRLADLRARPGVRSIRYSETEAVRIAGQVVFTDPHQRGAIVALWRQLSGDAHGLIWTSMTRASTRMSRMPRNSRYPLPMSELTLGGDLRELVDAFSAAFRILKVGWALFDERCTAP